MKTRFKAIVFDYGGVIEFLSKNNPIRLAADLLGVPFDDFRAEYFKQNYLSNAENMPWEIMFEGVVSVFASSRKQTEKVMDKIREDQSQRSFNTELINALSSFRVMGMKVALLSNNTTELRQHLKNEGLFEHFDEIVISGEVGIQKPSEEIFKILFETLNMNAEDVIFIDDAEKSLESASDVGYHPILFKSNAQLQSDLNELGITIRVV